MNNTKLKMTTKLIMGKSRKKATDVKTLKPQLSTKEKKEKKIKNVFIILVIFFFLMFIYLFINRRYDNYSQLFRYYYSTNGFGGKLNINYDLINNNILRWTNDGLTIISSDGKIKWTMSYNFNSPLYVKNKNYFAISGIGENKIFLFNENGLLAEINTDFPVVKFDLSMTGIIYVLLDSGTASFIEVYNNYGERIDITIKSLLQENGMPIDLAISDDGTELIVSYLYLDNTTVNTRVVFYNFDEVGKTVNENRIVAGFDNEYKGKYVSKVHFFNNERAVCFYDGGITFFSTKILSSPSVEKSIQFDSIMKSIAFNDEYVGVVLEQHNSTSNNEMYDSEYRYVIYDKMGKELSNKKFSFYYDNFIISEDYVIFINNSQVHIYDVLGREKLNRDFNNDLYYVGKMKNILFSELVLGCSDYCEVVSVY